MTVEVRQLLISAKVDEEGKSLTQSAFPVDDDMGCDGDRGGECGSGGSGGSGGNSAAGRQLRQQRRHMLGDVRRLFDRLIEEERGR